MSTAVDTANIILKLYELRREETMRKARDFMLGFDPKSFEEIQAVVIGPQGGYFRMVTSYWEMATSFVSSGAVDATTFHEAHGEHIVVFGKLEPYMAQIRNMFGNPNFMKNLEKVCAEAPGGLERVAAVRERIRGMLAARAAAAAA